MTAKEIFEYAKKKTGITQLEVSQRTGIPEQSIGQKIKNRGTVTMNEMFSVLECMGIGMYFQNDKQKVLLIIAGDKPKLSEDVKNYKRIRCARTLNKAWEIWRTILEVEGLTKTQFEKSLGYKVQVLEYKIMRRGSVKANEFFYICEQYEYIPKFFMLKERIPLDEYEREVPTYLKGFSEGTTYTTKGAKLVASSLYADGENKFGPDGKAQELYQDTKGRYFMVEYIDDPEDKGRIRAMPTAIIQAFLKAYGTEEETEEG